MNGFGVIKSENFEKIKKQIKISTFRANRKTKDINIVAVTKTFDVNSINSALNLGITCIGENKVQEIELKIPQIPNKYNKEVHFIGHLQSNKVRKVLKLVDVIQTVDTIKLANRINNICEELQIEKDIFLQVNISKDFSRYGFSSLEIFKSAEVISKMKNINLTGIMTIPPPLEKKEDIKYIFTQSQKIKDQIEKSINRKCKNLSMGMSNDYGLAIECGATHIRLGTALFGNRNY